MYVCWITPYNKTSNTDMKYRYFFKFAQNTLLNETIRKMPLLFVLFKDSDTCSYLTGAPVWTENIYKK